MRRQGFAVAIASSLVLAGAARADGYEPTVAATPALLQITKWTGFYANAGVGYGFWDAETTTDAPGRCVSCVPTNHAGSGWLGEFGVGYDYQFTRRIVGGVLFNFDVSDMRGKSSDAVFTTAGTSNDRAWFVGVRGGWLVTPDILNYWSVGYTQSHFSGGTLVNSYSGMQLPGAHLQHYEAGGWFLGGGLEVAVHDGWFWRNEVRYANYRNEVRLETGIRPTFLWNFDPAVGTAATEIVYKFDWHR